MITSLSTGIFIANLCIAALAAVIFEYKYFDDYFTDSTRDKYFIKFEEKLVGFVLINENNKFNQTGKTIAEFLIIPNFRRHHIGKKAAILSFEQYPGNWEVQPMENNPGAYNFWEKSYI